MSRRARFSWRKAAEQLGALIPRERLEPAVLAWTEGARRSRTPWHVGLSGGADSVALLLLLWAHWPERRRTLRALHFDHRLRGAASTADAVFCRRLCQALGVGCETGEWAREAAGRGASEAQARDARLAFFAAHARVVWLAHQQDDVAEGLLMRLARGSGTGGLSGPRPVQPMPGGRIFLRPLLNLRKPELLAALKKTGVRWREDSSNARPDFFRNRVRHQVIPAWVEAAGRDAVAGAGRSRALLAEDDAALELWVERLKPLGRTGELLLSRLRGVPRAVVRRALHRWLLNSPVKIEVSRQAYDALLAAVERGGPTRHSLGREVFAVLRRGRLRLDAGKPAAKFQRRVN